MSQRKRVAIGGFIHESNSFTGVDTTLADFGPPSGELTRGVGILTEHRETNTVPSGLLRGAIEQGCEPVPLLVANTNPSGPLTQETYETIRDELLERLKAEESLSGILLALHGAMVARGYDDPESDIITRVREIVGDIPVIAVLDMHANVGQATVDGLDALVGYKCYPHIDMAESGFTAARILARKLHDDIAIKKSYLWLPVLLPSINMRTEEEQGPMKDLQARARELCQAEPSCLDISVFGGFPYSDIPAAGASVMAYTDDDQELADRCVAELATQLWDRKDEFWVSLASPDEAVERALAATEHPVVLVEASDNPGSGATGDTPELLRALIKRSAENTVVILMHDPETVQRAQEIGPGNTGHFAIGGKINPNHGKPVEVDAYVRLLSDGKFVRSGPMGHGRTDTIGQSAVLVVDGIEIIVCEARANPIDPAVPRSLGIDPAERSIILMKGKGHFRAAYKDIAREIIDVDAPGAASFDVTSFNHQHVTRPIYPYDHDATPEWTPHTG